MTKCGRTITGLMQPRLTVCSCLMRFLTLAQDYNTSMPDEMGSIKRFTAVALCPTMKDNTACHPCQNTNVARWLQKLFVVLCCCPFLDLHANKPHTAVLDRKMGIFAC